MKKNATNLGTLGRVMNFLKKHGVEDIPTEVNPEEMAFIVVTELSSDNIIEFISIINEDADTEGLTDEKALRIIAGFFTKLGKNLQPFAMRLSYELRQRQDMATQKMAEVMEAKLKELNIFGETTTGTE